MSEEDRGSEERAESEEGSVSEENGVSQGEQGEEESGELEEAPLDHRWIRSVLPHRYPMLLVDRVLEIEPLRRIVCVKNVTQNEEFFQGHFPGHPVMPGVYAVEALAQAAGLLMMHGRPELRGRVIYFTGIEKARFRRPIVPGDQVRLEVEVLRLRRAHARFEARAWVDGEVAVEAICSSMLVGDVDASADGAAG